MLNQTERRAFFAGSGTGALAATLVWSVVTAGALHTQHARLTRPVASQAAAPAVTTGFWPLQDQPIDGEFAVAALPPPAPGPWAVWAAPAKGKVEMVVRRVIDGDTLEACYLYGPIKLRLRGIQAPDKDAEAKRAATAQMLELLNRRLHRTVQVELFGADKYGRGLADLWLGEEWLSDAMLETGHALPWDGRGKPPIP
jgi:endonuclease YncB( thermonuclease family)